MYDNAPIFVTGPARSGTSLVAGCLRACGAWTGQTLKGDAHNPHGYVENKAIREQVSKALLRELGADLRGVDPLPDRGAVLEMASLTGPRSRVRMVRDVVRSLVSEEGYEGGPWLYNGAKMAYLWPVYEAAFPGGAWVVTDRPDSEVTASCLRTPFMHSGRKRGKDPRFWEDWLLETRSRLYWLATTVGVVTVNTRNLVRGDYSAIREACELADLEFNEAAVREWVDPSVWGRGRPE